jgi:hypothetical protein
MNGNRNPAFPTRVRHIADAAQGQIDYLPADSVAATSVVVRRVLLICRSILARGSSEADGVCLIVWDRDRVTFFAILLRWSDPTDCGRSCAAGGVAARRGDPSTMECLGGNNRAGRAPGPKLGVDGEPSPTKLKRITRCDSRRGPARWAHSPAGCPWMGNLRPRPATEGCLVTGGDQPQNSPVRIEGTPRRRSLAAQGC